MKIEPHADVRQLAQSLGQIRIALEDAGFTRKETMEIILVMTPSLMTGGKR